VAAIWSGKAINNICLVFQLLESELKVKKTEIDKLVALGNDLSKSQLWPSDTDSVVTQLNDLRERLSAVESLVGID